ncbi:MAG: nucleoside triphosphate pyrophosphohydrolase [Nanoarchaeota archaeon]|nr:nucleoside triphosphate pyrophosphohydrolase [Nanoarchaeota archaeon]
MKHNKLIRDKIIDIINSKNEYAITHVASEGEYKIKLREKLLEEVNEFLKDENKEEMADIFEVLNLICKSKEWGMEDVENLRKEKAEKRGSFDKRIILDET